MTISIAVASSSQKKLLNGGKMTDEATLQQSARNAAWMLSLGMIVEWKLHNLSLN